MGLIGEYRVDLARGFMHIAEGVGSVRPRARPRNFIAPMPSKILTAVLILQAVLFYGLSRGELAVPVRPLSEFPPQIGECQMQRDNTMDEGVKESLRADDYLARDYSASRGRTIGLFLAFFKSQRAAQTPHSPKNCLPGSGWIWSVADTVPFRSQDGPHWPKESLHCLEGRRQSRGALLVSIARSRGRE